MKPLKIRLIDDKGRDVTIDLIAEFHSDAISITRISARKRNRNKSAWADFDGLDDGLGDKHTRDGHVGKRHCVRKEQSGEHRQLTNQQS